MCSIKPGESWPGCLIDRSEWADVHLCAHAGVSVCVVGVECQCVRWGGVRERERVDRGERLCKEEGVKTNPQQDISFGIAKRIKYARDANRLPAQIGRG